MWKADTPVERQAEARELWDDLTGINHSKEDTTARLERLFPEARTHNSEKKAGLSARDLEKLMIGTGIGVGGTYGGMTGYSKLKKNKQGYSKARIDLTADEAAQAVREEMGDLPPSKLKQKLINARRKAVDVAEENPLAATAALALTGSTVGGLKARGVAKKIKDAVTKRIKDSVK